MIEQLKIQKQDWSSIDNIIGKWLQERQSLILLLCAAHGLHEITPKETPTAVKIQAFCQIMMDYISAGHFEIYDKLMQEAEDFGEDGISLMREIYPKIDASTETVLKFNDKYSTPGKCEEFCHDLSVDLSEIAERLSGRFELEDQLIEALHNCHREMVA